MNIQVRTHLVRFRIDSPDGGEAYDKHTSVLTLEWPDGWRIPVTGDEFSYQVDKRTGIYGKVVGVVFSDKEVLVYVGRGRG